MTIIVNETVGIIIESSDGDSVGFVIPAYTQSTIKVEKAIEGHLEDYLRSSLDQDSPTSVGDFLLWLIRRASETEPTIVRR